MYWLVKSDPEEFGWKELLRDKRTAWTGVRNHTAAQNLRKMNKGDLVLFYESQGPKEIVGVAKVEKTFYPDPTYTEGKYAWVAVDLVPVKPLSKPITLAQIKADPKLNKMLLVRHTRLSVMPVTDEEYHYITQM